MKNITLMLTIAMASCYSTQGLSQSLPTADTIQWSVDNFIDTADSVATQFDTDSKFMIYGNKSISWLQKANAYELTYNIDSINGSWLDTGVDGTIVYNVHYQDTPGTLTFSRSDGQIKVQMFFGTDAKNTMPYIFHVTNILTVHP